MNGVIVNVFVDNNRLNPTLGLHVMCSGLDWSKVADV